MHLGTSFFNKVFHPFYHFLNLKTMSYPELPELVIFYFSDFGQISAPAHSPAPTPTPNPNPNPNPTPTPSHSHSHSHSWAHFR